MGGEPTDDGERQAVWKPGETVCTCFRLRRATRTVSQIYDRHLAMAGLRSTQFSLLSAIGDLSPRSLGPLAEKLGMDRTTLTRNLRPLEREGLVALGEGEDRRERVAMLTPDGRRRLAAARPHWRAAQDELERILGHETVGQLNTLLEGTSRRLQS
ncbi:MAG: MarR family winged helix-turn-helix transcriptional regulator [Azospirillaceae bacterium]